MRRERNSLPKARRIPFPNNNNNNNLMKVQNVPHITNSLESIYIYIYIIGKTEKNSN